MLALGLALGGCYSYTVRETSGSSLSGIAIDSNDTVSRTRWSLFWGLQQNDFKPIGCAEGEPRPDCQPQIPLCDHGIGQTQVRTAWYSTPLQIVTLGIAFPTRVTVWCATASPSPSLGDGDGPL